MALSHDEHIPHTCAYCQEELIELKESAPLFDEEKWIYYMEFKYNFKASASRAQEAATNGCAFWDWFIRDSLDDEDYRDRHVEDAGIVFDFDFIDHHDKTGQELPHFPLRRARAHKRDANESSGHGSLNVTADKGDPAYQYVQPIAEATPMHSEENFALARKWMEDCETHDGCAKPAPGVVPTRLLEINDSRVRLRPSVPGETLKWTALSYCWGGPQPMQTTTDILAERMEDIPILLLPQTIKDAITTTREIGLSYLWVDCLCIIQDDVDDVRREISMMPRIYRNASVTISAARAKTSNEGFLQDVSKIPPQDISFRLRFLCPDGQIGSLVFYGQDGVLPSRDPIETRAWTLQEHLLSQRVLIFGTRQIWWTCRKVHSNHAGKYFTSYSEVGEVRLRFLNLNVSQWRRAIANFHGQTWLSLVQHYTHRSLTFPHDKLLAISGIAKYYSVVRREKYLAGHFETSLLSSLLWKRHSHILPRPADYRAPSWSWAAIDSQINFELHRSPMPHILEVIDCKVEVRSEDAPYGAVKSGTLTVRGKLRQLLWNENRDALIDASQSSGTPRTFFAETTPDATISHHTSGPTLIYCLEICTYTPSPEEQDYHRGQDDPIGRTRTLQNSGLPKGLLLEKCQDWSVLENEKNVPESSVKRWYRSVHWGKANIYRRVGIFAFRDVDDLPVEKGRREDVNFREEVDLEKRLFFEGCAVEVLRII